MVQPPQRAHHRVGIGRCREIAPLFAPRFLGRRRRRGRWLSACGRAAQVRRGGIRRYRNVGQQISHLLAHCRQCVPRGQPQHPVGAGGRNQQSHRECDSAAEADLEHAVERGLKDRLLARGPQQDDHRSYRRHPKGWVKGHQTGQRHQGDRQRNAGRQGIRVGKRRSDHGPPGRPADRAEKAIEHRLQRAADACLHDDDRGQHGPIIPSETEKLRQRKSDQPGGAHAERQPHFQLIFRQPVGHRRRSATSASTITV